MTSNTLISCRTIDKIEVFENLKDQWKVLHESNDSSFFLSWDWQYTWWQTFRTHVGFCPILSIIAFYHHEKLVGLLPLYRNPTKSSFRLIGIGEQDDVSVYSELLDLLTLPGMKEQCLDALKHLSCRTLSKLQLGPIKSNCALASLVEYLMKHRKFRNYNPADLPGFEARLDEGFEAYLSLLSSSTRSRIKRLLKKSDSLGYELQTSDDIDTKLEWFSEMVTLHQTDWTSRGHPGAFRNAKIISFHERLLKLSAAPQVYKLHCPSSRETLGVLYGFLSKTRFEWYQMGLNPHTQVKSVGVLLHAATLRHVANHTPISTYDFLVGRNSLKESLSTHRYNTSVATLKQPNLKDSTMQLLRYVRKYWKPASP